MADPSSRHLRVDQPVAGEDRDEERQHPHEGGSGLAEALTLGEGFIDEEVLALLQVAKPAVHELGRLRRRARHEVMSLDERSAQSARRGIERDASTGDASADDQHVEVLVAQPRQRPRPVERGERHQWSS